LDPGLRPSPAFAARARRRRGMPSSAGVALLSTASAPARAAPLGPSASARPVGFRSACPLPLGALRFLVLLVRRRLFLEKSAPARRGAVFTAAIIVRTHRGRRSTGDADGARGVRSGWTGRG
jgi:hypothetical protein